MYEEKTDIKIPVKGYSSIYERDIQRELELDEFLKTFEDSFDEEA